MFLLRRIASRKRKEEERAKLRLFSDGLRLDGVEELLEQGLFSRAYEEAEKALADGKDKERCLLILGGAAYRLRKWELSVRHYAKLCEAFPSNEDAQDRMLAALSRLDEERTGNYDFWKLYEAALRDETDVDVADYLGPIKVVDIPGKGKGIVATRDVKKGTLLLVSKAFIIAPRYMPDSAIVAVIQEKLAREPERINEVAALYYGCERDAAALTQESVWESVTNTSRLMQVCWYNGFKAGAFNRVSEGQTHRGIWILPSYFNHSCLPSARRVFYGDVMTAFAAMDIKQGEELTFDYTPLIDSYEQRKSHLAKYRVVCDCRLCELDRQDPRCSEREKLAKETIDKLFERPPKAKKAIPILTRLVEQIRATYADRPEDLKTQLYSPLKTLAGAHHANGEHDEAVKCLLEAVKCIPESAMTFYGVWAYVQIAECCDLMRRPRTARIYARIAANLHRIRSGHDDKLFKKIHTSIAHLL